MVTLYSKFYTVSTRLFHKYEGANVAVTNFMSHFSMSVPTKVTVKMDNGNTVHSQGIGIILCCFLNCPIIYPVGQVCYFLGHPSNTISLGALNFYVSFQKVKYEPIEHCGSVDPQGHSWRSPNHNQNNLENLQMEVSKVKPPDKQ